MSSAVYVPSHSQTVGKRPRQPGPSKTVAAFTPCTRSSRPNFRCSYVSLQATIFWATTRTDGPFDQPPKLHSGIHHARGVALQQCRAALGRATSEARKRTPQAGWQYSQPCSSGLVFLTLQGFEYTDHWKTLTPYSDYVRLDLLHHNQFPRRSRDRRISAACLCRNSAALWSDTCAALSSLPNGCALLALRRLCLDLYRRVSLRSSQYSVCPLISIAQRPKKRCPTAGFWFGVGASVWAWFAVGLSDMFITWRACLHQEDFGGPSAHPAPACFSSSSLFF